MGVLVERIDESTYSFEARDIDFDYLQSEDYRQRAARLRGSVMIIGPLLARFGVGYIPKPGGDKIGRASARHPFPRFSEAGRRVRLRYGNQFLFRRGPPPERLLHAARRGVGDRTANIVMAAVLAEGRTTIYNAACEPYVQQLCRMLNRMGALISGIASNLLVIDGVERLHGTTHTLLPDMIEVGSFIGMAAMTRSEVTIRDVSFENLGIIPAQFARMGIQFEQRGDDIYIPAPRPLRNREFHRRLDHEHSRRSLARVDARPAVGLSGRCDAGQRVGADSPEDVRESPVFRG